MPAWSLPHCFLLSFLFLASVLSAQEEKKRIAIVRDDDSPYFDEIKDGFKEELTKLASGSYTIELVDQYNARGNSDEVAALLQRALDDPTIDVVYAAGIVSSHRAKNLPQLQRTKPIMAGAIEFSEFDSSTISKGTSTIPLFTFIVEARRVPADLTELARISGQKKIHTLIDGMAVSSLADELTPRVDAMEEKLGLDVVVVPAGKTAQSCLANLPKSAKAVYLPILPNLQDGERAKLIEGLTKRGVISFSMKGESDVKAGALASLSPDSSVALHRRTALNLHQMLSGIPTSLLPVYLRNNDRLRVNMKTAKRVGWSPDFDTLLSAEFIQMADIQKYDGDLTLEEAMSLAFKSNADIRVARARLSSSYWETQSLRASQNPQISITGSAGRQGIINPLSPLSQATTDAFTLGAEITKILYSDRLTSAIRAKEQVQSATKLDLESVQLDAMQTAGQAYLNCLLVDALFLIEKENLALAYQNLNLAKTRKDIGSAEPSEVFRWQASLAQAKSELIQRDASRKNARFALNVSLGQRAAKNYRFQDIPLADNEFYFMGDELSVLLTNLEKFEAYVGFIKEMSLWRAPELKAFDKSLSAQGVLLQERGRRNTRPEISLTATARQLLSEVSQNYDSQGEWGIGIGFTIPFGDGGARKSDLEQIRAAIRQLEAQRDKATYLVEQRALTNAYNASSSYPGVRLTREAQRAAEKNYKAVQEKYGEGAASVIDLIDALSQLIGQRKAAASAKYSYIQDAIGIQRSMAWFEFARTPAEKKLWTRMLRNYLQSGSLHIKIINKK